jgi:hypothetical protein
MKRLGWLGLVVLLIGCADQPLKAALDPTIGKNIGVVVAKLGYPNDIHQASGGLIYVWGARSAFTNLVPAGNATTVPAACTVEIAVGGDSRIQSYQSTGNQEDCEPFARALSSK